jgi:uncharacterized membrane protein YgaE (UPF0421/DUF939 family)
MEIVFLLYVLLIVVGLILAVAVILAPLKLYEISRELKKLNGTMRDHTRLLAAIANAADPTETTDQEEEKARLEARQVPLFSRQYGSSPPERPNPQGREI